jgi:CheY-like chemotaxis protein
MRTQEPSPPAIDVLIAEDDLSVREALRCLLENEGYTCAVAENGREAVEIAHESPPRLVLLDLMMPELDGFGAARQLRRDPRTRDVHIHCLTSRTDRAARVQARRAGCEVYLTKPMDVEGIRDVICIALNS